MNIVGCLDTPTSAATVPRRPGGGGSRATSGRSPRHYLGFVFQGFNLLPRTTAVEKWSCRCSSRSAGAAARRQEAGQALHRWADRLGNAHVGGTVGRAGSSAWRFARALVTRPLVLLADERREPGHGAQPRDHGADRFAQSRSRHHGADVTHEPEAAAYAGRVRQIRPTAGSRRHRQGRVH